MKSTKRQKTPLTQALVKEWLDYDKQTGTFTWRRPRSNVRAGHEAGTLTDSGYLLITLLSSPCRAHRLAWLYVYGQLPDGDIDHIDGDRLNNRIENLRIVSKSVNQQNMRRPYASNKVGLLGVCPNRRGWRATITIAGKWTSIGTFETPELAHQAYLSAKRQHHPGFVGMADQVRKHSGEPQ